jgi:hypothetical protein
MENLKGFTTGTNPNYAYKDLGNDYVITVERWGKNKRINLMAVHKAETIETKNSPFYAPYECNHKKRIKSPIEGIVVNERYVRLMEGTSFPSKYLNMAIEVLENRLKH